jgi:hypothetical protein
MKKIVFACGFLGILGVLGIGCGTNKCQALADAITNKYSECGVTLPSATSGGVSAECTDALAKTSECYTPALIRRAVVRQNYCNATGSEGRSGNSLW